MEDHTGTDNTSDSHVGADGVVADGEGTGNGSGLETEGLIVILAARVRSISRGSASSSGGSGNLLVGLVGRLELSLARVLVLSLLGGGLALEVTGVGVAVLVLVVGIEDVSELGLVVTHAVGTVDTSSSIGVDGSADLLVLAADVTEDLVEVLSLEVIGGNTASALDHAVAESLVRDRREGRVGLPALRLRRASGGLVVGGLVVVLVNTLGVGSVGLLLELGVILELDSITVLANLDQTVVVGLLVVHVDDTTAEDIGHDLLLVESSGLVKDTAGSTIGLVAAVLGEEDGDGVVLEELGLVGVTRVLHAALATPRVDVVTPVVDARIVFATVEVVGNILTNVDIIVGGITDTEPALKLALKVLLGVTDGGLDKGRSLGVGDVVGNLVTGKETDNIVVLAELIDNVNVSLVQLNVPLGVVSVDGEGRLGKIRDNVDTGIIEELHTSRVVGRGVNGVGSDDVGTELLEERDIALTSLLVGERVDVGLLTGALTSSSRVLLVSDTLHEELGSVGVEELGTLGTVSGVYRGLCAQRTFMVMGSSLALAAAAAAATITAEYFIVCCVSNG
ncbi:hypothetical protein HG531_009848 [Fusarium graminearum]|nr:hypothetical protein HG531_009848 [Fusarium graminearum]